MRKYSWRHGLTAGLLPILALVLPGGCGDLFGPLEDCTPGEELPPVNEGAICVDGKVVCPDGRRPCAYFAVIDGKNTPVHGCLRECIECPVGSGICYYKHPDTGEMSWVCTKNEKDCFNTWAYVDLFHTQTDCPTASKDCVAGR